MSAQLKTNITEADPNHSSRYILGLRIDGSNYDDAVERILAMPEKDQFGYVCIATVHMVMEAHDDYSFQRIVNSANLVTSDGMPLVWGLRFQGLTNAQRVYGPSLTPILCKRAAAMGWPVGFYGGTDEVVDQMKANLSAEIPSLNIAYAYSPPFHPLTPEEDEAAVRQIRASGVKILFVGLGCPKQERWMAEHADRVDAVQVGVGAAFDFLAGQKAQAPRWVQNAGLEWLFRLATEPRRLWKRYLYHNPRFIYLYGKQLLTHKLGWGRN